MSSGIHLDTNALIAGLDAEQPLAAQLRGWRTDGIAISVSSMVWAEFLCGPVTSDAVRIWQRLLSQPVLSVDGSIAMRAATLFNLAGRRSRSLPDCIIAATAIEHGARLCTLNRTDFELLIPHGLELV